MKKWRKGMMKGVFKQRMTRFLPYCIAIIGLFFAGFVSFFLSTYPQLSKIENQEKKMQISPTVHSLTPTLQPSISIEKKPVTKTVASAIPSPTQQILTATPVPSMAQPNPSPTQATTPTDIPSPSVGVHKLNVSINGSPTFDVSVFEGANQCEVLNKAMDEGKIASLNIRYDSSMGTYAVYQINGTGKENSVWWTYKVNGQSPSQGCSYVKADNNDNVVWEYIGS